MNKLPIFYASHFEDRTLHLHLRNLVTAGENNDVTFTDVLFTCTRFHVQLIHSAEPFSGRELELEKSNL